MQRIAQSRVLRALLILRAGQMHMTLSGEENGEPTKNTLDSADDGIPRAHSLPIETSYRGNRHSSPHKGGMKKPIRP